MRTLSYLNALILSLFLCIPLIASAGPSNAPDHRYTIKGFVLDAQDNPRPDVKVVATVDNGLSGQRTTDRRGFYSINLHLHNEDLNRLVTVQAGKQQARVRVAFDPSDSSTNREHDLNFVGGSISETDLGFRGLPTWAYVSAGLVLLTFAAARVARVQLRRKRRLARQSQKAPNHTKTRSRRKSRAR
ncbi:MAG: carboxypeptidase regulatory-like domain-containing protein [Oceanospirillaceae bacterium]|nr:carboxypeptidase regulatory-like domain-containing protein [Oceanospirillaceae bacterium]